MAFLFRSIVYLLFFLMLVFPMVLELLYVKALLFAVLILLYSLILVKRKYLPIHPFILTWAIFFAFTGIIFFILGWFNKTPGVYKEGLTYILWPMVYLFILSSMVDPKLEKGLKLTIIISTMILSFYGISQILVNLYVLPEWFTFKPFKSEEVGFGNYKGYIETTIHGINSMPFLVPFCLTSLVFMIDHEKNIHNKIILVLAVFVSLIFSFFTARRALWLVIMLAPIFMIIFTLISFPKISIRLKMKPKKFFLMFLMAAVIIVGLIYFFSFVYDFDFNSIVRNFLSAFNFGPENKERVDQFYALFKGIKEHPFCGSGLGASAERFGSIRSIEMPWSYELYYVAFLFQVGIIGFALYTLGVIWTYTQAIKIMSNNKTLRNVLMPYLVGMSCMFVAGATNPVFIRFDGIWFFFLPLAMINVLMLKKRYFTI